MIDRRHNELSLVGRLHVPLGIASQGDPCANGKIAYAACSVVLLGLELMRKHPRAREPFMIVPRVTCMRDVDRDVGQELRKIIAGLALINAARGSRFVNSSLLVVPRWATGHARHQPRMQRKQRDCIALLRAGVTRVQAHRASRRFR
ncbi:hypothetical protein ABD05_01890 [Burkholderia pyrrocinia]|nr:hypothetical protein ABD05_01890 [Burkholderia pyrrocinia]